MPSPEEVAAARSILDDLALVTSTELVAMWDQLGSWDRKDIPRLAAAARPLIVAAARTASRTQSALSGLQAIGTDRIATARVEQLHKPFTASWHALSEGRPWEEAIDVGRSATEAYGRDVAYQSARETMAFDTRSAKFVRSVGPGSCDWCQQFDGVEFTSADAATFGHDRCNCIIVPFL